MASEAVNAILSKASGSEEFRRALLEDAEKALKEYELTKEEIDAFKGIDPNMAFAFEAEKIKVKLNKPKKKKKASDACF